MGGSAGTRGETAAGAAKFEKSKAAGAGACGAAEAGGAIALKSNGAGASEAAGGGTYAGTAGTVGGLAPGGRSEVKSNAPPLVGGATAATAGCVSAVDEPGAD